MRVLDRRRPRGRDTSNRRRWGTCPPVLTNEPLYEARRPGTSAPSHGANHRASSAKATSGCLRLRGIAGSWRTCLHNDASLASTGASRSTKEAWARSSLRELWSGQRDLCIPSHVRSRYRDHPAIIGQLSAIRRRADASAASERRSGLMPGPASAGLAGDPKRLSCGQEEKGRNARPRKGPPTGPPPSISLEPTGTSA